jgi:hypothetical protein
MLRINATAKRETIVRIFNFFPSAFFNLAGHYRFSDQYTTNYSNKVRLIRKIENEAESVEEVCKMVRSIIAAVIGIAAGSLVIMLAESAGHAIWPPPEGLVLDPNSPASLKKYMDAVPEAAKASVVVGWGIGSLVSGLVAMLVSKERTTARFTGIVMLVAVLLNLMMIPHPLWMMLGGVILPIPLALVGAKLAMKLV